MNIVRAELGQAKCLIGQNSAVDYCGRLAGICLGVADAPDVSDVEVSEWHCLARVVLARSWLLGASVWEHFDVLLRVAPDLARRLVDERLLDGHASV